MFALDRVKTSRLRDEALVVFWLCEGMVLPIQQGSQWFTSGYFLAKNGISASLEGKRPLTGMATGHNAWAGTNLCRSGRPMCACPNQLGHPWGKYARRRGSSMMA